MRDKAKEGNKNVISGLQRRCFLTNREIKHKKAKLAVSSVAKSLPEQLYELIL